MRKENIVLNEKNEEEQRTEMENDVTVKQLTLDEFKAQTAAKRSEPQFNIRKAGEGANEKEFGKLIPLPKREIVEEPVDEIVVVVSCQYIIFLSRYLCVMWSVEREGIRCW